MLCRIWSPLAFLEEPLEAIQCFVRGLASRHPSPSSIQAAGKAQNREKDEEKKSDKNVGKQPEKKVERKPAAEAAAKPPQPKPTQTEHPQLKPLQPSPPKLKQRVEEPDAHAEGKARDEGKPKGDPARVSSTAAEPWQPPSREVDASESMDR